jgi:RNA polymerase sigma-70 factor (ECF subfamily)
VLTKLFGPQNLQLAEDVVQDTLLLAFHTWKIRGVPENSSAWLFTVARNKAIDLLRKQKREGIAFQNLSSLLQSEYSLVPKVYELVNTDTIEDDQLRMMFVCCHPSLSGEAQVSLILKTLCGFSVTEIARAFVAGYDTIEKRLYRARQSFRDNNVQFQLPAAAELEQRMSNVLMAIYLLFNEGYNATQHENLIRKDLMSEAIRLGELICRSNIADHSNAHALLALLCFNASRSDSRLDEDGNILLLQLQDRSKWNRQLIMAGVEHLEASANGNQISKYHLEAGIAYEHARAPGYDTTNWYNILTCYDLLCTHYPSPVISLNRAIVLAELYGPQKAIEAIAAIPQLSALKKYYLLPATLGELHVRLKNYTLAKDFLSEALKLTQSSSEKKLLLQKIKNIPG